MNIFLRSCSSALVALAFLLFAGCSSSNTQQGGITVVAVDLKPAPNGAPADAVLTLQVTNESIGPLGFSGSSHRLFLDGNLAAKVDNTHPFGVPPLRSITEDVTVHFENPELIRQLAASSSHSAGYRLESILRQTIYEDKSLLKINASGTLNLGKLAGVSP